MDGWDLMALRIRSQLKYIHANIISVQKLLKAKLIKKSANIGMIFK